MTFESRKVIEEFVDEFIMTAKNPMKEAFKIMKEFYAYKITKLEKHIVKLDKENTKLKKGKNNFTPFMCDWKNQPFSRGNKMQT